VQAYAARNTEEAIKLVIAWLDSGENGLLAIDETLLAEFGDEVRQRMDDAEQLPYLALPSGEPATTAVPVQHFVAEMIRRTVGFQLSFPGDE